MASTARRALLLVLVLSLVLTACGRSETRVTADDGRGVDRPGGGIWIPETRGVDVEDDDALEAEDGEAEDLDAPDDDGSEDAVVRASETVEADPDEPEALELPSPQRQNDDAGTPEPSPGSSDDGDGGRTDRKDEQPGSSPEEDAEDDDEPAEPEMVGDCGVAQAQAPPTRTALEEEVDRLRALVAERWPDTQAGAWIVDDEDGLTVHVGFTRGVRSSLRAACEEFGYPELLHGVRTELSEVEIEEHLEVVLAERDALREGEPPEDLPREIRDTQGRYVAHIDHAANGLLITVEEPTEQLRDAFRDRYLERLRLAEGSFDDDGELVVDEDE